MWKGHCRHAWDRTAALRHTIMQCGFGQPKRMPKVVDLNPVRAAEKEVDYEGDFDAFDSKMEKVVLKEM